MRDSIRLANQRHPLAAGLAVAVQRMHPRGVPDLRVLAGRVFRVETETLAQLVNFKPAAAVVELVDSALVQPTVKAELVVLVLVPTSREVHSYLGAAVVVGSDMTPEPRPVSVKPVVARAETV